MKALDLLIVEDEPLSRGLLVGLLREEADVGEIAEAGSVAEAVTCLGRRRADLLLLDLELPDGTGLDLLRRLPPEERPPVVFVTASDRFAVEAFAHHALDYLLKPVGSAALQRALARVRRQIHTQGVAALAERMEDLLRQLGPGMSAGGRSGAAPGQVVVRSGAGLQVFESDELLWVQSEGDYLRFHGRARSAFVRETMRHFLGRAPAGRFVRIHKSAAVNVGAVRRVEPISSGDHRVTLADGVVLRASRSFAGELLALLQAPPQAPVAR